MAEPQTQDPPAASPRTWGFVVNNVLVGRVEVEAPGGTRKEAEATLRRWLTQGIQAVE